MRHATAALTCLAIVGLAPRSDAKGQADEITHSTLAGPMAVDSVVFPAGTTLTYVSRRHYGEIGPPYLVGATLGSDGVPCGVSLEKGAVVSFSNGRYGERGYDFSRIEDRVMTFVAPRDLAIEGVDVAKGSKLTVQCRGDFGIGPHGHPQRLRRAGPITKAYTLGKLSFPEDSQLEWYPFAEGAHLASAVLGEDSSIGAYALPQGTTVTFHPDGVMQSVAGPHGRMKVGDATCALDQRRLGETPPVEFHPNGALAVCVLPSTSKSTDWNCKHSSGTPQLCDLSDEQQVDGFHVVGSIERYPSGALKKACLSREQVISGLWVMGWVSLHENGTLREAAVRTQMIGGVEVQGWIELSETRSLKTGAP